MTFHEALIQFATAVTGTFLVLGFWMAVQSYVRRNSGCRRDRDVLDFMAHGCGSCLRGDVCKNRLKNAEPHAGGGHTS